MIANQHDVTVIVEDAVDQLDAAGSVCRTQALTLLRDESQRLLDACTLAKALLNSCTHERLDMDGICRACGADRRGI